MKTHKLKLTQPYFDYGRLGIKKFELRKNDRDYQVGDLIVLQEFSCKKLLEEDCFGNLHGVETGYTGREYTAVITFILKYYEGLEEGYCVLGVEKLEEKL